MKRKKGWRRRFQPFFWIGLPDTMFFVPFQGPRGVSGPQGAPATRGSLVSHWQDESWISQYNYMYIACLNCHWLLRLACNLKRLKVQLDLGYPAISYPDVSIIRPRSCSIFCLFSTSCQLLAQDKNKEVKYLFYFIVYPFYINDKLLQIE